MYSEDDILYAFESTQVLHEPDRRIDTFGTTRFRFHLITELMDNVNRVRIRNGEVSAEQPKILRPEGMEDLTFEGFGEQAEAVKGWLKTLDVPFLKYGFNFTNSGFTESVVHDSVEAVRDRLLADIRETGNPLSAVIQGVDDTWEISLIKFTLEMIQKSRGINVFDFKRRGLL